MARVDFEFETTGSVHDIIDEGLGQSIYHYSDDVPSTGHGRDGDMGQIDQPAGADTGPVMAVQQNKPATPAVADTSQSLVSYVKMPIALGIGAGALTTVGVWALMKWSGCPAADDKKAMAGVGGVATVSMTLAALAMKKWRNLSK